MSLARSSMLQILLPLLTCAVCHAQTLPCGDSSVTVGTFATSADLPVGPGFSPFSGGQITWNSDAMLHGSGQINYRIDMQSVVVTGSGSAVDSMTTSQIVDLMARESVLRGITLGYTPCSDTCIDVKVSQAACVLRSGSGTTTSFTPCTASGCCTRIYRVCCPKDGPPVVTLTGSTSDGCGGIGTGCESTCPDGENGGEISGRLDSEYKPSITSQHFAHHAQESRK